MAIQKHLTERRLREYTQNRIAKIITLDNTAKLIDYTNKDYTRNVTDIFMSILSKDSRFRETIKSVIKETINIK